MAEPAVKPMSVEEFLCWDDGTETRYELIGGFPVAAPSSVEAQRILAVRLVTRIDTPLAGRRPCNAQVNAGVIRRGCADDFVAADIAATCASLDPQRQAIKDPFLVVEILSSSLTPFVMPRFSPGRNRRTPG